MLGVPDVLGGGCTLLRGVLGGVCPVEGRILLEKARLAEKTRSVSARCSIVLLMLLAGSLRFFNRGAMRRMRRMTEGVVSAVSAVSAWVR